MVAKLLTYIPGVDGAGIVLGARVPIILTSGADGALDPVRHRPALCPS